MIISKTKYSRIILICAGGFILGTILLVYAYFNNPQGWSCASLLLSLGVAFIQLSLTLFIVNVYFDKIEKREKAVQRQLEEQNRDRQRQLAKQESIKQHRRNVLKIILDPIKIFNFHFNNLISHFGTCAYNEIIKKCKKDPNYPNYMPQEDVDRYIAVIKPEYDELLEKIEVLVDRSRLAISSGLLNDEEDIFTSNAHAIQIYGQLKSQDINNPMNYRLIFAEIALLYGRTVMIAKELYGV